jgi:LmbE family N-acetylglucosaminyl deacetylase
VSRTLLIAPHADDESLFAAYLAQRYAAHVHVVYDEGRQAELELATAWLGCGFSQGNVPKGASADVVEASLIGLRDPSGADDWDLVIAPAVVLVLGHEEHNLVGQLAEQTFRDVPITWYATYAPRGQRTVGRKESFPAEPEHVARKLAALSCYRSQIADPATAPWFYSLLDMREWAA